MARAKTKNTTERSNGSMLGFEAAPPLGCGGQAPRGWHTQRSTVDPAQRYRAAGGDPPREDREGDVEFEKITTLEPDQQTILNYLKVRL
jgi:hypothetical protein